MFPLIRTMGRHKEHKTDSINRFTDTEHKSFSFVRSGQRERGTIVERVICLNFLIRFEHFFKLFFYD